MDENSFFIVFAVLKNFDNKSLRVVWEEKKMRSDFPDVFEYLDIEKKNVSQVKVRKETIDKILLFLDR